MASLSWFLFYACLVLTVVAFFRIPQLTQRSPVSDAAERPSDHDDEQIAELVWWYGWVTCASTALGVVPLMIFRCLSRPNATGREAATAMILPAAGGETREISAPDSRPARAPARKAKATPPSTVIADDTDEESKIIRGPKPEKRRSLSSSSSLARARKPGSRGPGSAHRQSRKKSSSAVSAIAASSSAVGAASAGSLPPPSSSLSSLHTIHGAAVDRFLSASSSGSDCTTGTLDGSVGAGAGEGEGGEGGDESSGGVSRKSATSVASTEQPSSSSSSPSSSPLAPLPAARAVTRVLTGYSNAVAGGMMLAASLALAIEGSCHTAATSAVATSANPSHHFTLSSALQVVAGVLLGLLFVKATESFIERWEEAHPGGIESLMLMPSSSTGDAKRMLLIFAVMTLHSAAEGIGLGVSFGVKEEDGGGGAALHQHQTSSSSSSLSSATFGPFISAALAVHNAPEGLLIASQLLPASSSSDASSSSSSAAVASAPLPMPFHVVALWCIFSSLPQPITAVPAFLLVQYFSPLLSLGLGFAAGAMTFVSVAELLPEACVALGGKKLKTGMIALVSGLAMAGLQSVLK